MVCGIELGELDFWYTGFYSICGLLKSKSIIWASHLLIPEKTPNYFLVTSNVDKHLKSILESWKSSKTVQSARLNATIFRIKSPTLITRTSRNIFELFNIGCEQKCECKYNDKFSDLTLVQMKMHTDVESLFNYTTSNIKW